MINIDFHGLWRFSSQQMIWVEKKTTLKQGLAEEQNLDNMKSKQIKLEVRAGAQKNKSVQQKLFFNLMPDLYVWFF